MWSSGRAQQRFQRRADYRFPVTRAIQLQAAFRAKRGHGLPQPGRGFRCRACRKSNVSGKATGRRQARQPILLPLLRSGPG